MAETIGGLSILGTSTPFTYTSEDPSVSYPHTSDDGPYTILGPVLLPQIYGKDLNAIEVGSSGIIALSIYDKNVLNINSNLNTTNIDGSSFNMITVESQSVDDALQLRSGTSTNKVVLDSLLVSESGDQNVISTSKDSILMDDAVNISGVLSVEQDTTLNAKLSVHDTVTLSSTLSVAGITTFSSDMFIEGKTFQIPVGANAARPFYSEDITVDGSAPAGSIFFNSEDSQFQGLHDDGVWRQFGGVIDTDGNTKILAETTAGSDENTLFFYANDDTTAKMIMTETTLSVNLDVVNSETLSVAKSVVLESDLSIGSFARVGGYLSVGGATLINNEFKVADKSIFVGEVTAQNAVSLASTLDVTGHATFEDSITVNGSMVEVEKMNVNGDLSVMGVTFLNSNLNVVGGVKMTDEVLLESTLSVESNAHFKANAFVQEKLSVTGAVTFNDYLSVGNRVVLADTLSVGGQTLLNSGLSVTGSVALASDVVTTGKTLLKNTLSVGGLTTMGSHLSVNGDVTLAQNNLLRTDRIQTTHQREDMYLQLGDDENGTLYLRGHLEVKGTVSQTDSTVQNISILDKKIVLASGEDTAGENSIIVEDKNETNHKAGIEVEGLPVGFDSNNAYYNDDNLGNVYEKSFLWHVSESKTPDGASDGLTYTGPLMTLSDRTETNIGAVAQEAFWELKGGQLRLSSVFKDANGDLEKIAYSMRITKKKELQFMKHEWKNDELGVFTRQVPVQVATFGVNFR